MYTALKTLEKKNRSSLITLLFISIVIVFVNSLIEAGRFADYFSYVELVDQYFFFPGENWFLFEPASTLLFISLRYITGSATFSVDIAHYLLGLFYIFFMLKIVTEYKASWQSLLLCFCIFGPLLAFVTIRATPAYLFVALAFFETLRSKYKALLYVGLGALFHMSAMLALIPILLGLLQNRSRGFSWIYSAGLGTFITLVGTLTLITLAQTYFSDTIFDLISNIPLLSRYLVYVSSSSSNSVSATSIGPSIFHFLYLICCSLFLLLFLTNKSEICRKSRLFIFSSYIFFVVMQFSPVSAFRQSIFWMVPAIFVFPWSVFTGGRYGAYPLSVCALAVFAYQLSTVFV